MKRRLRYSSFTAIPDRADVLLRAGRHSDYAILAVLYRRQNFDTLTASASLDQLAEWVGWTRRLDSLSKRLRKLRDEGWLGYDTATAQRTRRYVFHLVPEQSESGPNGFARIGPNETDSEGRSTSGNQASVSSDTSEHESAPEPHVGPNERPDGPNGESSASSLLEQDSAVSPPGNVRTPQRIRVNLLGKENKRTTSWFVEDDHDVGEGTDEAELERLLEETITGPPTGTEVDG
ncbi:MAG: hypothetical protein H0U03_02750 [Actinobacteria bacterium]|nr:hypothetical protein [Actinomycetota bacterium]